MEQRRTVKYGNRLITFIWDDANPSEGDFEIHPGVPDYDVMDHYNGVWNIVSGKVNWICGDMDDDGDKIESFIIEEMRKIILLQTPIAEERFRIVDESICEMTRPVECPACGGHIKLDATWVDQADDSNGICCPYCRNTFRLPEDL